MVFIYFVYSLPPSLMGVFIQYKIISIIMNIYKFILLTIESSFKGRGPRTLPPLSAAWANRPSSASPLNPFSVTPRKRLLSGVRIKLLAFSKLFLVGKLTLYIFSYIQTIILIIKALKIANSAKASVLLEPDGLACEFLYGLLD